MGVATHAISHLADGHEQHQQDQDHHENQCGQCLSLSHLANANTAPAFDFTFNKAKPAFTASTSARFQATTLTSYTARGPPVTSQA